jgi:hypothetical protein
MLPERTRRGAAVELFSAKLQRQFHQIFERGEEQNLIHGDAVDLLSSSKEYAAVIACEQTLRKDDLGFCVTDLARLANIAGNAHANLKQPELSLQRHEFACDLLRDTGGSLATDAKGPPLEQFAYSLAQRVRRLVPLQRLDVATSCGCISQGNAASG